jgi:hypothetical protein
MVDRSGAGCRRRRTGEKSARGHPDAQFFRGNKGILFARIPTLAVSRQAIGEPHRLRTGEPLLGIFGDFQQQRVELGASGV